MAKESILQFLVLLGTIISSYALKCYDGIGGEAFQTTFNQSNCLSFSKSCAVVEVESSTVINNKKLTLTSYYHRCSFGNCSNMCIPFSSQPGIEKCNAKCCTTDLCNKPAPSKHALKCFSGTTARGQNTNVTTMTTCPLLLTSCYQLVAKLGDTVVTTGQGCTRIIDKCEDLCNTVLAGYKNGTAGTGAPMPTCDVTCCDKSLCNSGVPTITDKDVKNNSVILMSSFRT